MKHKKAMVESTMGKLLLFLAILIVLVIISIIFRDKIKELIEKFFEVLGG